MKSRAAASKTLVTPAIMPQRLRWRAGADREPAGVDAVAQLIRG